MEDPQLQIAKAGSRRLSVWNNIQTTWGELTKRLQNVTRTGESTAEYKAMPKAMKDARKDVGGYVGGYLDNGKRRKGAVKFRDLLTLDLDYSPKLETLKGILSPLGFALVAYPTHSSTPEKPRYRVVAPFGRHVTSEEYEPIARKIASRIGIDYMDSTTYEPERLMYWPSVPQDADATVYVQEGAAIDADAVLKEYDNWRDASAWPVGKKETVAHTRTRKAALSARSAAPIPSARRWKHFCRAYMCRCSVTRTVSRTRRARPRAALSSTTSCSFVAITTQIQQAAGMKSMRSTSCACTSSARWTEKRTSSRR